jgi:UDP-N-acetylmuramyl-tripeptide synthetase
MDAAGIPAASRGTLGLTVRGLNVPGDRTTPEAPAIHAALRELVDSGVRGVAMEVSSHALSLQRTAGLMFDVALFTNLTQDHLDFYHGDMEEYFRAKRLLFTAGQGPGSCTAVINTDDPYGARLASDLRIPCISFGMGIGCRLSAESLQIGPVSVSFTARIDDLSVQVAAPVGGRFNVYNLLGAVGASLALGIEPGAIERGLAGMPPVNGRFEAVHCGQPYTVLVDYAHTPDGLFKVLQSAREIASGKLHVVFGCGGDRDRGKRPLMGAIAAGLADEVVLTSDNSRSEEQAAIIAEIRAGIQAGEGGRVRQEVDRRAAIQMALEACQAGDVLVIAGKGHEPYQIFADRTIHFDDREVVRELLEPGGAP